MRNFFILLRPLVYIVPKSILLHMQNILFSPKHFHLHLLISLLLRDSLLSEPFDLLLVMREHLLLPLVIVAVHLKSILSRSSHFLFVSLSVL